MNRTLRTAETILAVLFVALLALAFLVAAGDNKGLAKAVGLAGFGCFFTMVGLFALRGKPDTASPRKGGST